MDELEEAWPLIAGVTREAERGERSGREKRRNALSDFRLLEAEAS